MIHCQKCKTVNPSDAKNCSQCGVDLLPDDIFRERLIMTPIYLVISILFIIGACFWASFGVTRLSYHPLWGLAIIVGGLIAGVRLFIEGYKGLSKKVGLPLAKRYEKRAKYHLDLDPQQTIDDLTQALNNISQGDRDWRISILEDRADVYEKLGMLEQAKGDWQATLPLLNKAIEARRDQKDKERVQERANYIDEMIEMLGKLGMNQEIARIKKEFHLQ